MTTRFLWANKPGESTPSHLIPCFPSAKSNQCALSKSEIDFLLNGLSSLYSKILDSLTRALKNSVGIDSQLSRIILRESVVLITYALVDRILRINKLLRQQQFLGCGVITSDHIILPETNADFCALVDGSQAFNQYLLSKLGSFIWNLTPMTSTHSSVSRVKDENQTKNRTFDAPDLLTRIKRKFIRTLSAHSGRIAALRLANIESALLDGGLYGLNNLIWLDYSENIGKSERDPDLRELLRNELTLEIGTTLSHDLFKNKILLRECEAKRAEAIFCELLLALIPPGRLEGISERNLACEQQLKKFSPSALLFCSNPTDEEIHLIAAARWLRIPVVGVQHGAHYGFTNQTCHVEIEYVYCNYFISWGWSKLPEHRLCKDIQTIQLPSPWLSERVKRWKQLPTLRSSLRVERPYDVLLMSDRIQLFPPTAVTLRMSRIDLLSQLNSTISEIVLELAQRKIRILNKPYNQTSRDIQAPVLDDLATYFSEYYSECQSLDKGLSEELLKKAWLVIWDEPGTGFFECLAGGIPTVLYWGRLTFGEEEYARTYFESLEAVGLLHNSVKSLADEVEKFLGDPVNWTLHKKRALAIQEVTNRFSKTDDEWSKAWMLALKDLGR
jgi:hypothetical protein